MNTLNAIITRGWGLGPKGPFLSVLTGRRGGEHLSDTFNTRGTMNNYTQQQLIIVIRSLAFYLEDQIKEGDLDNAKETAKLISIASHYVTTK